MGTTYRICRFDKPTKNDLKEVTVFSEYDRYDLLDDEGYDTGSYIQLFRKDNPYVSNLLQTRFAVGLTLPEIYTDRERLFRDLGFPEESIQKKHIYLQYRNDWHYIYSDGDVTKRIGLDTHKKYDVTIQTECFAIKIRTLWDSEDVYFYPDRDRIDKYIPGLDEHMYVPVNNGMLAKAEIPFLIFERNRGCCFLERS